jgi:hypothetical protein
MDTAALKKGGRDIGSWPSGATGDFDGRLSPMMKLILAADPKAAEAMTKLGPGFEFQDVDSDDPQQVAATVDLAAAIKSLLADLSAHNPQALRERLSAALGREVTDVEATALTAGIAPDVLRGVAGWLGVRTNAGTPQATSPTMASLSHTTQPYGQSGTWSRDDTRFTVQYIPATHADPILASWLELLASTPRLESNPVAAAMFKELTKPTAAGLCASCHSTERAADGKLAINWKAYDRTREPSGFTKFAHAPHLVLPQLANCTSCHAIDVAATPAASYADYDPRQFVSDFKPMAKVQCAACHIKSVAGDRCQSCHNYHVEAAESWRVQSPVGERHREANLDRLRIADFGLRIEERKSQSAIRTPHSVFH